MSTRSHMVFLSGVALLIAACGYLPVFGDPLKEVNIENTTSIPLRIYQDGVRRTLPLDVAPHTTAETAFPWPIDGSDGRTRTIIAEDASGKRIYCERFGFADLVKVKWKITVIERDLCD